MKNKKSIMLVSSLLILIFHLWVSIFDRTNIFFKIETFIRQICYIGVDIFFFLSSYSISKNDIKDYKKYLFLRFKKVYIPFMIFAIIGEIYYKWNLKTFLLTISGINLFIDGGGSFLWFVPAIMIVYLLLPIYNKIYNKYKKITPIITIIIWIIFTVLISSYTSYKEIFILTNRLPIILIGVYFAKNSLIDKLSKKKYLISMVLLIIFGLYILYWFKNINFIYIKDVFYLTAIPFTLGIILLANLISTNSIIDKLGSITLEIYAIQMIFGYKITTVILDFTKKALLTNILVIIIIFMLSIIFNFFYNKITFIIKNICYNNKE